MGYVLGLVGKPGSGKSEVRKILEKNHKFEVINSKIAIYNCAAEVTGLPASHFSDPEYKNGTYERIPLRVIAGRIGDSIEDMFGDDFLIRKAMANHKVENRPNTNFVIDSLRKTQPALLASEVFTVEVFRSSVTATGHGFDEWRGATHYTIPNNGTKEDLELAVSQVWNLIKSPF